MPNETDYLIDLSMGLVRMRVRFLSDGPVVTSFMVQLEALYSEEWKPVRRFDDYHGSPHLDYLDRWGREYGKEWINTDRNSALNMAIQDFETNWERYVAEFLKDETHE